MSSTRTSSLPAGLAEQLSLLDSITDVSAADANKIVLSGSHGGMYPAAVASRAKVRAVVFNDAGIGLDGAGIKGVEALAGVGMAAASVDCKSARIGSAQDMLESGAISYVNDVAAQAGVMVSMPVVQALSVLAKAVSPAEHLPAVDEARWQVRPDALEMSTPEAQVLCVDSASLVKPEDAGRIIITGSHGGLIGGDPARALKAKARLAVFNDAGFGKDRIGVSRLPALDQSGVAAFTVSNTSAVIGSAQSCLQTGIVSCVNQLASDMGIEEGMSVKTALSKL